MWNGKTLSVVLPTYNEKDSIAETIRGFERSGIGPRDACQNPVTGAPVPNCRRDSLGGKLFWATTAELRFPLPFVPDSLGMQGAVFIDAGSLWDPSQTAINSVGLPPGKEGCIIGVQCGEGSYILDTADIRLSTGVSLIWASPLGPLRADIAEALLKADFDETELFRFGASTNF